MVTVHVYAKLRNYPKYPRSTLKEVFAAMLVSIPALMTPVIIIGGKIFGWFTATESAAIAVIYAAVLSIFVYRELKGAALYEALHRHRKARRRGAVLRRHGARLRLAARLLPDPEGAARRRRQLGHGASPRRLLHRLCFLVVGCFLDAIPAIIIVGTILEPLAGSVDMDPVHFAMVGIISLAFGLVTPPYGLCLMISCAIAKVRLMYVIKDVMIMLMPMIGVLAAAIFFPEIILFLPRLISPEFLK